MILCYNYEEACGLARFKSIRATMLSRFLYTAEVDELYCEYFVDNKLPFENMLHNNNI